MNDKETLLNAIFFPRPSFIEKDEKDHLVDVDDGIHVSVRFFLKNKTYSTILFFHGNAELSQEYDDIAEIYHRFECNFIVADYRGYGFSNGEPSKETLHLDSNKIFKYVLGFLKENSYSGKMIVMGRSLGSAAACEIISKNEDNIDGCIIESGFGTEIPLMKILDLHPEDVGYDPKKGFENLRKIKEYSKPLLVIHANEDDIIPINEATRMYDEAGSMKKDIWIIPNANHNNIFMHAQNSYFKKIKSFIDKI